MNWCEMLQVMPLHFVSFGGSDDHLMEPHDHGYVCHGGYSVFHHPYPCACHSVVVLVQMVAVVQQQHAMMMNG